MAATRTFSIIKPDATRRNLTGAITKMLEDAGLRVVASKRIRMTRDQAEGFYAVHKERPFYGSLVSFMTSGPCMPMILEKTDAVAALRTAIGATDPAQAEEGTVRKLYAESKERNAIHASDSDDNANREARRDRIVHKRRVPGEQRHPGDDLEVVRADAAQPPERLDAAFPASRQSAHLVVERLRSALVETRYFPSGV